MPHLEVRVRTKSATRVKVPQPEFGCGGERGRKPADQDKAIFVRDRLGLADQDTKLMDPHIE
jgi:hypothetical protein